MVDINTILYAIERALSGAEGVDDDLAYATYEFDADNSHTALDFPFVEIQVTDLNRHDQTPDETPITDDSGGRVGTLYRISWTADVQVGVRVDSGPGTHDARTLGTQIENELYRYDAEIRSTDLFDADGDPLVEINDLRVDAGASRDDIASSPAIRQWVTTLEVGFNRTLDSTDVFGEQVYVDEVVTPQWGDFTATGDGNEVEFDARDEFSTS